MPRRSSAKKEAIHRIAVDFQMTEQNTPSFTWFVDLLMRPRAILRAGRTLYVGGVPNQVDAKDLSAAYEGRKGGLLWVFSPDDGAKTAEYKLDSPPVWDGLAAANGRMYVSTADGRLLCMGGAG